MKKSGNITDMSTVEDVYTALRDYPINSERGTAFEKLMARYFQLHPTLRQEYDRVVRWPDWEFNGGRADTGIDLVAHRSDDDSWTAIQCKFYEQSTTLTKGAVLEPQQPEITNSKEGVTSGFLCFWGGMNVECVPGGVAGTSPNLGVFTSHFAEV